jgi:hypothetical protein
VTHTYDQGYLTGYALNRGWTADAPKTRRAIDRVLSEVNTSVLERAVKETFLQSKGILKSAAASIQKALGRRSSPTEVEQAIESIEPEEERQIEGVVTRLQKNIEQVPSGHFDRLREMMDKAMGES